MEKKEHDNLLNLGPKGPSLRIYKKPGGTQGLIPNSMHLAVSTLLTLACSRLVNSFFLPAPLLNHFYMMKSVSALIFNKTLNDISFNHCHKRNTKVS